MAIEEDDLTKAKKKKLGDRTRAEIKKTVETPITLKPGTPGIGDTFDPEKAKAAIYSETIQAAQRTQGGVGAAPGAQTPDASGTGARTDVSTFQGKPITEEQKRRGVGKDVTPLEDRLASYARATKTYEEMNAMRRGEGRGLGVSPGITTIGQTGGYGLLDKGRREETRIRREREGKEKDIRRAMQRGEVSPRNAATMLRTISQEALGREEMGRKERETGGQLASEYAALGARTREAGEESMLKRAGLGLREQELGISEERLELDFGKAELDKRFKSGRLSLDKKKHIENIMGRFAREGGDPKIVAGEISLVDPELAKAWFPQHFNEEK